MKRLRIREIRIELDELKSGAPDAAVLRSRTARKLGIDVREIAHLVIVRESVDARRDPHLKFTVDVEVRGTLTERLRRRGFDLAPPDFVPIHERPETEPLRLSFGHSPNPPQGAAPCLRPIVVGFGPAGIFAALQLACAGLRPIVLEQGDDVDTRSERVAAFWRSGTLDPYSNVQFGEGGAGTFSDGKLTTRIKDERIGFVLRELVSSGAPEEILYRNKPHIGTDLLTGVVRNLRRRILEHGGEVRFGRRVVRIVPGETHRVEAVLTRPEPSSALPGAAEPRTEILETDALILATGHSGREMFEMLKTMGLPMERKPFAVGLRIEHPQEIVDRAQYGGFGGESGDAHKKATSVLGAADYKLSYTTSAGRSVYSFCMCPGGRVVGAASEHGHLVVNGMSYHARRDPHANAALLVNVDPVDLGDPGDVLAGVRFQQSLERAAYLATASAPGVKCPYYAPAQYVGDFLAAGAAPEPRAASASDAETPDTSFEPGVVLTDLRALLPDFVGDAIAEALPVFGSKIEGFDDSGTLLIGVESRSSSPVRVLRDPGTLRSSGGYAIYPCGEGAGYAGGITSAAVDGVRVAEAVIRERLRRLGFCPEIPPSSC